MVKYNYEQSNKLEVVEVVKNMKRYIALLRGINISGKNKVPMAELKQGFEKLNYTGFPVQTLQKSSVFR